MGAEELEKKIEAVKPREVRFIDPMKLAQWSLETCIAMVDHGVSAKTICRAIDNKELVAFQVGKLTTITPIDFLTWYKRNKK